jgi:hypothetical protein
MEVVIFLPEGKTQSYDNVTGLRSENGLVTFQYESKGKKQEVRTTLPVLAEKEAGKPTATVL